jgi:predicted RNA-binding protein with TRAM domain
MVEISDSLHTVFAGEIKSREPALDSVENREEPPVEEGEVRPVAVESIGDKGDGIAKVAHGYVVIVPGTKPGDTPTVEITNVQDNVAFADVVDSDQSAT